jgi:hypothetical protein
MHFYTVGLHRHNLKLPRWVTSWILVTRNICSKTFFCWQNCGYVALAKIVKHHVQVHWTVPTGHSPLTQSRQPASSKVRAKTTFYPEIVDPSTNLFQLSSLSRFTKIVLFAQGHILPSKNIGSQAIISFASVSSNRFSWKCSDPGHKIFLVPVHSWNCCSSIGSGNGVQRASTYLPINLSWVQK